MQRILMHGCIQAKTLLLLLTTATGPGDIDCKFSLYLNIHCSKNFVHLIFVVDLKPQNFSNSEQFPNYGISLTDKEREMREGFVQNSAQV